MRSNGSVMWGHNGTALLDLAYDSLSKDTQVGFSLSALLNTTIKEVSPLRGLVTYTQSPNHAWVLLDVEVSLLNSWEMVIKKINHEDSKNCYSLKEVFY